MEEKMEEFLSFRRILGSGFLYTHCLICWGDFFVSALFLYDVPFLSI